jgi:hypothetical protein
LEVRLGSGVVIKVGEDKLVSEVGKAVVKVMVSKVIWLMRVVSRWEELVRERGVKVFRDKGGWK